MVRPLRRAIEGRSVEAAVAEPSAPPPAPLAPPPLDDGPARRLQQELERALSGAPAEPRWSPRRSAAFIVVTNALAWTALIWGLRAVF